MDLLRFTTAGSVDDGKSTLIGRLLVDTGSVPEDQLAAVRRASRGGGLDLSLVTDGLRAEREQGITIDVAYRSFATPRRQFLVADTPGHVQYTRNMATGASTAALAVVLVDAVRGVQTQTRRHAFVSSLLGIPQLVVAVNKMDLVGFDEGAFEAVRADVLAFASRLRVAGVTVLPVAALGGDNVVRRSDAMPWYDGPTLLHHLETVSVASGRNLRDLRVPVGLVLRPDAPPSAAPRGLAATVASGILRPGDEVVVLPEGVPARVASVATFDGALEEARAGDAVVVTLDRDVDAGRGQMLVRPGNRPATTVALDAMLCWMAEAPLAVGRRYLLRHTTREVAATVDTVVYRVDVDTLHREAAPTLGLNDVGRVRISTAEPVMVDPYEVNRETGAFVLIDADTFDTVAAGMARGPARDEEAGASAGTTPRVSPDVVWEGPGVTREEREAAQGHGAAVVWLTGLPASGKSTVARAVERRLFAAGVRTVLLDGDGVRHGLSGDLGFSPADRTENLRRAGEAAALMAEAGLVVVCAFVSPLRADRAAVLTRLRRDLPTGRVVEVHVDAELATVRARDPKGLYARADRGELPGLTGVGAPYEPPGAPDLHLDTARLSVAEAVEAVVGHLVRAGLVPATV